MKNITPTPNGKYWLRLKRGERTWSRVYDNAETAIYVRDRMNRLLGSAAQSHIRERANKTIKTGMKEISVALPVTGFPAIEARFSVDGMRYSRSFALGSRELQDAVWNAIRFVWDTRVKLGKVGRVEAARRAAEDAARVYRTLKHKITLPELPQERDAVTVSYS